MTCRPNSVRLGGELEFNAPDFAVDLRFDWASRFAGRHCTWVDTGRSALFLAAKAILRRGGQPRVWIPAYSCASMSAPFLQAGFEVTYYPVGSGLQDDGSAFPEAASGEVVVFIHYFGHRNHAAMRAASEYRAGGTWVIEDGVQGGLLDGIGRCSDFAVTSYRKLLPVTDGAALIADRPFGPLQDAGQALHPPDEAFVTSRLVGKIMRGSRAVAREFLPLFEFSEKCLGDVIVPRDISWLSSWMLERIDGDKVAAMRRTNWQLLREGIDGAGLFGKVTPILPVLHGGDAPLGMPVRVTDCKRDELRRFLASREIYCSIHWPLHHLPATPGFDVERDLASTALTLPVDQKMGPGEISRIIDAMKAFFRLARQGERQKT